MRVADFFCGGGGFSEGFRQAGFEIVFAVDKWEPAVTTYKGNKPGVNVIKDDVIRISRLPDEEFEQLVPDSEVIIGSPPCQSFSHSNKSGNADKSLGIKLIEAYLRIIARKKFKANSVLKYWVLENVPAVKEHIKSEYTAADLGLEGDFILKTHEGASGKYNAKYFGAPTNRERYLCGDFPQPERIKEDNNVVTLGMILESLALTNPNNGQQIKDINYPGLSLAPNDVTDHQYTYELASFEWKTAERLKRDKGYMGKMSFPENVQKPARTVMATMSCSSREAMILGMGNERYRLPTVREAASMMSFPIDYRFYGKTKATKHTLVGNAVPPKMSYAIAKAIAYAEGESVPDHYIRINHDPDIDFINLNGNVFAMKQEKPRRNITKFKYHIPYLILSEYRVELTNYNSDFKVLDFKWDVEIHYSQGKVKAKKYTPKIPLTCIDAKYKDAIERFIDVYRKSIPTHNTFQNYFCMTTQQRKEKDVYGPFELLNQVKLFIEKTIADEDVNRMVIIDQTPNELPLAIIVGYYVLVEITKLMKGNK